jgi:mRNA interferase RelE/StbE
MRVVITETFATGYVGAPPEVQKAFGKQLAHLLRNLRHPSLRAKKYDEARHMWQARVNDDWRFYFTIQGDAYILSSIRTHPK